MGTDIPLMNTKKRLLHFFKRLRSSSAAVGQEADCAEVEAVSATVTFVLSLWVWGGAWVSQVSV